MTPSDAEIEAGRAYLAALQRLGLQPEAMCWLFTPERNADGVILEDESSAGSLTLAIVSKFAEYAGPAAVYELLFRAYDAAALPKEVDPFSVTVFGPHSSAGLTLTTQLTRTSFNSAKEDIEGKLERPDQPAMLILTNPDMDGTLLSVPVSGVYVLPHKLPNEAQTRRRFNRFKSTVEGLAI